MLQITRDKSGKHFVDGKPFDLYHKHGLYRKKVLVRAIQIFEPFTVETLKGTMTGEIGDWLMVGVEGEMYPCDAAIFAKTYEAA